MPDKWRLELDKYIMIAEKKMASCVSLLIMCDLFNLIKKQKAKSHKKVNLSQII
jgi:hypothetical protein